MSNVLLVDTNFSSEPIYQYLINSGHKVTVVGGKPKDALAKCVEDFVNLDYSDVAMMRRLIEDRNIDYVVPGCNDLSYIVCAELNKDGIFLGIDSLENAKTINNKEKFRTFSRDHKLPTPQVLAQAEYGTRWPVIIKPVDAFSGRGVSIILESNKWQFEDALNHACSVSKTGECIVEDYVDGQLYSHSAFVENGRIVFDCVVEEHGTTNQFTVDTSRVVYDFPGPMLRDIREKIEFLASALSLQDGLLHTQFIHNGTEYWLIEVTRRCPGDLYSQLIELSTGINYAENYARKFIGMPFNFDVQKQKRWIMRHTLTQSTEFILGSLEFFVPVKMAKWVAIASAGDKLGASPSGRIAVMFAETLTEHELDVLFAATIGRQLYKVNS